jgi:hypothetical protein
LRIQVEKRKGDGRHNVGCFLNESTSDTQRIGRADRPEAHAERWRSPASPANGKGARFRKNPELGEALAQAWHLLD